MSLGLSLALYLFVLLGEATTSKSANYPLEVAVDELAKEWVVELAKKVVENHQPGVRSNCRLDCQSYRLACQPFPLDSHYGCFELPENNKLFINDTCELSGDHPKCIEAQMFMGSYIWLPWWIELRSRTKDSNLQDTLEESLKGMSCEQKRTLCSQMELDKIFRSKYSESPLNLTKFAWSMFGASNGIFRIYPGSELRKTTCDKPFDPRKRPWYKVHTAVKKEIVVLLDTSKRMSSDELESHWGLPGESTLEATKLMVKDFLETLTVDDKVWIYTFDESEPLKIPETPFYVGAYRSDELKEGLDLNLTKAIDSIGVPKETGTSIGQGANLTKAINYVLNDPGLFNQSEKVLKWESPDRTSTSEYGYENIRDDACNIEANYTNIVRATYMTDHLAGLQPYYNYLATLKHRHSNRTEIVRQYDSYSLIGPVKSISYPAFDGENFIGVASVDIPETFFGTSDESLEAPENTNAPESCQNSQKSESCVEVRESFDCNNAQLDDGGYDTRTCCTKDCKSSNLSIGSPPTPPPADAPRENSTTAVRIGAPIGAATVLILAILAGFLYWRKAISSRRSSARNPNGLIDLPNSSTAPHSSSTQTDFNDPL